MPNPFLEVGALVRHRLRPDWGLGQIQSMIAGRITVNFENEGKVVLVGDDPPLDLVQPDIL
ncbi:MAG: DUF3553 domain-containing protein [Pseudomonadota bacterium]